MPHPTRSLHRLPARLAFAVGTLAAIAFAPRPATCACTVAVPDNPQCACATTGGSWPTSIDQDQLITNARRSLVASNSCLRHGGQPYWQIQMMVNSPTDANFIANANPSIGTDFPREAWCTETVAFWHAMALMPFLGGYGNPDWYPSSYVTNVTAMRTWYRTEEELRARGRGGRGRWIGGSELDYANFQPGVNGPCPGAYQAHQAWDSVGGQWADSSYHSQVVDSMVVWRQGSMSGPVVALDLHVIEGNAGGGTFVDVSGDTVKRGKTKNETWYRNVIDYTRLGHLTTGGPRKIRGWGIDLHADGSTYCDSGRMSTVVILNSIAYPAPIGPDNPDSITVGTIVDYVMSRPGPIQVTSNAAQVTTGGALPGPANHWLVPQGSYSTDPVWIQVDLRAEHPLPVRGVVIDWKGAVPSQFSIQWAAQTGAPMSRSFAMASGGGSPDPTSDRTPIALRLTPAAHYSVRYLRLLIPASMMATRGYEIPGLHLLFDYGTEDDNGGVFEGEGSTVGVGPETWQAPGAGLRMGPGVPNPFGARTRITFELPAAVSVEVEIYDVAGRRVRDIAFPEGRPGRNEVVWDGRDDTGGLLRDGAYFVSVTAGGERGVRRVLMLRR